MVPNGIHINIYMLTRTQFYTPQRARIKYARREFLLEYVFPPPLPQPTSSASSLSSRKVVRLFPNTDHNLYNIKTLFQQNNTHAQIRSRGGRSGGYSSDRDQALLFQNKNQMITYHHPLTKWFGVGYFLVISPIHDKFLTESQASSLLSSLSMACASCCSIIPAFIPLQETWQHLYAGRGVGLDTSASSSNALAQQNFTNEFRFDVRKSGK